MLRNDIKQFFSSFLYFSSRSSMYKQRELIGLFCGKKKEHLRVKDKKIFWYFFFIILYDETTWAWKREFNCKSFISRKKPGGGSTAKLCGWLSPDFFFFFLSNSSLKPLTRYNHFIFIPTSSSHLMMLIIIVTKCMFQYFDLIFKCGLTCVVYILYLKRLRLRIFLYRVVSVGKINNFV